jgi:hypothetical protein
MTRWKDRSVQVDPATLNRNSVDRLLAYAKELGYRTHETSLLDIDGTVMVTITGYGEDFEAYYRPNLATGYLRWGYGNRLSSYSADRIGAEKELRSSMAAALQMAVDNGWKGESGM